MFHYYEVTAIELGYFVQLIRQVILEGIDLMILIFLGGGIFSPPYFFKISFFVRGRVW